MHQTPWGFAGFYTVDFMDGIQNSSLYRFLPPAPNPTFGEKTI